MSSRVRADGIAVYVFRRPSRKSWRGLEFLQLRRSHKTGEYQHSWQIVYGGIKKKETATQAALRELDEETGLAPLTMAQVEYIETFYFRPHDYVLVMPVFVVEAAFTARVRLNEEHVESRWIKERDIARRFMWRTQREALAVILDQIKRPPLAREMLRIDLVRLE